MLSRPFHRLATLFSITLIAAAGLLWFFGQLSGLVTTTAVSCINNLAADTYPCHNIDLLSFVPLSTFGSTAANDIWGWTDADTGREYALLGLNDGVAFVDITDAMNPIYLGQLSTHTLPAVQRDLKVYQNVVYIVAEANNHGMQVFDLTQLRQVNNPPQNFASTNHYGQFGRAHNIAINEDSGYAYVVGADTGAETCAGGLHMIDLQDPLTPSFAGCFSDDGYTHDTQCVIYHGADSRYTNHELCFNANTDTLTIVDVTDKTAPVMLAREAYSGVAYAHQGWLTADHNHFLLGDENDEQTLGHNTRTYIWDVTNLQAPYVASHYTGDSPAIDHNLYIHNNLVFAANYQSGLRVLAPEKGDYTNLREAAYFDILPAGDSPGFNGAWSSYPFFESGSVIVSGREQGLFVLKLVREASFGPASQRTTHPNQLITHTLPFTNTGVDTSFQFALTGATWPTELGITDTLAVAADETIMIPVRVKTPNTIGVTDTFTLTAVSTPPANQIVVVTGSTTTAVSPNLSVQPNISTRSGEIGAMVNHTFTITNTGDYTDTFALELAGNLWPTTAPSHTPSLAPNEQTAVSVQVQVTPTKQGDPIIAASDSFTLTVRSGWETAVLATATGTTLALGQPALETSGNASLMATPNQAITHTITVTNTGNFTDNFDIEIHGNKWTTFSEVDEIGPLAPNATATADIVVVAGNARIDSAIITLRSRLDPTTYAQLRLETRVSYAAYLPLLRKEP